jgi:hypothetical protein
MTLRRSRRFLMTLVSWGVSSGDDGTRAADGVTGLGVSSFGSATAETERLFDDLEAFDVALTGTTTPKDALRFFETGRRRVGDFEVSGRRRTCEGRYSDV